MNHQWHALEIKDVVDFLQTNEQEGLTTVDANNRIKVYGQNVLPSKKLPTMLEIFARQFLSPLIYILIAAGLFSTMIGETIDALFIFIVILANALLGSFQEYGAEKSAAALQNLLKIYARTKRDGKIIDLPAEELLPGDIIYLESGNKVPADVRFVQVNQLTIDESLLTGESIARMKDVQSLSTDNPISDRLNMGYAGSTVVSGRGIGIVVATGHSTELGKIADATVSTESNKPPLSIRMEKFSKDISYIVLGVCVLLAVLASYQGIAYVDIFFLAVALAVSAIPEGLPVAITVALSVATKRMSKRSVIVRKLTAVESLGSCTFVASDKTGTLTVNQQTVKLIVLPSGDKFKITGEGYNGTGEILNNSSHLNRIVESAIMTNEATLDDEQQEWVHSGDAVDVALLALGYKHGIQPKAFRNSKKIIHDIPFESELRYSATFYQDGEVVKLAIKGALESILPLCSHTMSSGEVASIDTQAIEQQANDLANQGYRVIAIADATLSQHVPRVTPAISDVRNLNLLGLIALIDPLRPEVKAAVDTCHQAGVQVAMITGDHPLTALAIAKELGIANNGKDVITGSQLAVFEDFTHPGFLEVVKRVRVFARVTPLQKLQIVQALTQLGNFVAVTGDGANDAPALKNANIGVAMGSGTDVTKEIASIIVTDDNFTSIVAGIEEGRTAYINIRKVIYLLVATGFAEVLLFLFALLFGLPIPLLAVQILWLNLVTNGFQHVTLALEGAERDIMKRPPRKPSEGIFNPVMIKQICISGATMAIGAFGLWASLLSLGMDEHMARNLILMLMVLFENIHVFNCRSETLSAFRVPISRNYYVIGGVVAAFGIHIFATHNSVLQNILQVEPIPLGTFFPLLLLASFLLVVMELFKFRLEKQ
ncbi:ATPase [Desulfuribacillus stibiiarsenatis]|uniref:ATPase n=1 Tax=Desulfuribacillus stibiiarsenatis TaxID=1390249 RepID=A0A1E5L8H0_9FIRM|nr:HAD-IC family P-type ATPase [Desulfuribacillus stibiiarsenatis]OEH86289.1 ATPase [Desulfuribacillus stibiiarsenatis]